VTSKLNNFYEKLIEIPSMPIRVHFSDFLRDITHPGQVILTQNPLLRHLTCIHSIAQLMFFLFLWGEVYLFVS